MILTKFGVFSNFEIFRVCLIQDDREREGEGEMRDREDRQCSV